jgi:thiol-disulfide isomerase/thioredoxin
MEAMFIEEGSSKEGFARFSRRDPDALLKEAEAVLQRTIKEFGDVPGGGDPIGKEAGSELDEIRNLRVGRPVPEITGKDVDGKPLKLSDHKGKVVCVVFWANWCGACRGMYAYERSLVKRMRGKPFVLLGVNGDGDRNKVREQMKQEGIDWQSWWDGGGDANNTGPIARQFNVNAWPTLYILDHHGVICHKFLGSPGTGRLDLSIDALVEAVEKGADVPKKEGPG